MPTRSLLFQDYTSLTLRAPRKRVPAKADPETGETTKPEKVSGGFVEVQLTGHDHKSAPVRVTVDADDWAIIKADRVSGGLVRHLIDTRLLFEE